MRLARKLSKPEIYVRLGLGIMFLYSGYDIIRNPDNWISFIGNTPEWARSIIEQIGTDKFLLGQGIVEMLIGVVMLVWFLPRRLLKLAAFVAVIEIASILWLVGIDLVTFRDIGLLGAAVSVLAFAARRR